jgi:hypothetical protein
MPPSRVQKKPSHLFLLRRQLRTRPHKKASSMPREVRSLGRSESALLVFDEVLLVHEPLQVTRCRRGPQSKCLLEELDGGPVILSCAADPTVVGDHGIGCGDPSVDAGKACSIPESGRRRRLRGGEELLGLGHEDARVVLRGRPSPVPTHCFP